jgi:hypothetical protein
MRALASKKKTQGAPRARATALYAFAAAATLYKALFGFAPMGSGFKWRALAVAAAFAFIGPTAYALVERAPPRRWIAVAAAVLFAIVLLKIGDDANYEFIYFQF